MTSKALKIGDKVRFLNDAGEGVVTQILENGQVMVEDDNGFEYAHLAGRLIGVEKCAG